MAFRPTERIRAVSLGFAVLCAVALMVLPAVAGAPGTPEPQTIHVVARGETLGEIAATYGVPVADIIEANDIRNPNRIYSGQRLVIPVVVLLMPTPAPLSAGTPAAAVAPSPVAASTSTATLSLTPEPAVGCLTSCEAISIVAPTRGVTVTTPLTVTGFGAAADQLLAVRVLDATGYEIGLGMASIAGPPGEIGFFTGTISITVPANTQSGRIQVYSISPDDGAIEHLASVLVILQGSGLDRTIERVKAALEAKEYDVLAAPMSDPWDLMFYRSEGLSLSADRAFETLRETYLEPSKVFVDLSVDARALLGDGIVYPPEVTHVVYSTGWGPDQADDAFLLFETDATGQTRWGGMVYVFEALKDYPAPAARSGQ